MRPTKPVITVNGGPPRVQDAIAGLALAWVILIPACGGHATPARDAAASSGPTCPPIQGGVAPGAAGNGFIEGPQVSALLCNVSVLVFSQSFPDRFFLRLNDSNVPPTVDVELPAGATAGTVQGFISLLAPGGIPAPGIYTSATSPCGILDFGYQVPTPGQAQCAGGGCAPSTLNFGYEAAVAANCAEGTQAVMGSWALTLTSVDADGGTPSAGATAHGQLTAGLVGFGFGEPATFALAF